MHFKKMAPAAVVMFVPVLTAVASATLAGPTVRKPAVPASRTSPRPPAARTTSPTAQPPLINLTATVAEPRRAQIRLAGFITAVQARDWVKASTFLSQRVTPAERKQMLTGPWLRPQGRNDPAVLYYMPQIEIRTKVYQTTQACLRVLPYRWESRRGRAFGLMDIWMSRENNKWMVNIHPTVRSAGMP